MNVLTRCKELGSVHFAHRTAILKIQQSPDLFVGNINTVADRLFPVHRMCSCSVRPMPTLEWYKGHDFLTLGWWLCQESAVLEGAACGARWVSC